MLTGRKRMSDRPDGHAIVYCEGAFAHAERQDGPRPRAADPALRGRWRSSIRPARAATPASCSTAGRAASRSSPSLAAAIGATARAGRRATHFVDRPRPRRRSAPSAAVAAAVRGRARARPARRFGAARLPVRRRRVRRARRARATCASATCASRRRAPSCTSSAARSSEVDSLKVAVLGTDSAVGKRTTAWVLVDALEAAGVSAELVGTGTDRLDAGRALRRSSSTRSSTTSSPARSSTRSWSAWRERAPAAIVIEGQGSLMNPAYPGGFEILAAGRPDVVVLQHAPAREEYDGFPGYPIAPARAADPGDRAAVGQARRRGHA